MVGEQQSLHNMHFVAANEAATLRCAAWLAQLVEAGWLIFLQGDLGAGKTAFARGLIRAKCGAKTQVPSPSFTLVQPYDEAVPPILHSDFYRLAEAQEIDELGIIDALDTHCCLIEWSERAADLLPPPAVIVHLSLAELPDNTQLAENTPENMPRHITISAGEDIIAALQAARARDTQLGGFLADTDWRQAERAALAGDASSRRYERLHLGARSAVLMDWAKGPDGPPIYDGKPYSAVVHLAEAMPAYCRMVDWLRAHDLAAPEILARDEENGFALMEDFGDRHLANDATLDRPIFYAEAVANLLHLHQSPAADFLPVYDGQVQAVEASLFTDWYCPAQHLDVSPEAAKDWQARWQKLGDALVQDYLPDNDASPLSAGGFVNGKVTVLRDYHSVNLIWRQNAQSRFRVGLIDVQDALAGHPAYDLSSLLCDARIDVDAATRAHWLAAYRVARFGDDEAAADKFDAAFAIATVQRNAKIAGIFNRLAVRDSKPGYLRHLPRVLAYMRSYLSHPSLAPIADWLDINAPQFLTDGEEK